MFGILLYDILFFGIPAILIYWLLSEEGQTLVEKTGYVRIQ